MQLAALLAAVAAALAVGRPGQPGQPGQHGRAGRVGAAGPRAGWGPVSGHVGAPAAGGQVEPHVGSQGTARPGTRGARSALLLGAAAATWAITSSVLTGTQLGVAVVAGGTGLAVARVEAAGERAEQARRRRRSVVDFCEALVGELRAGRPVLPALERSAVVWPEALPLLSAARLDADLPAALRRLAQSPGAEALEHLAAAWQLCSATGGGLVEAAGQVLDAARSDAASLRQVEGEVSSARATARLVAALPVVVLVAGQGLGARPWSFLLGRPLGVVCLAAGILLVVLGLAWIDRIAASATSGEA